MSDYKIPDVKNAHYEKYLEEMPSQKGKLIAITGTTTGTGKTVAKAIASKGGHVLALNRPSGRATASSLEINTNAPDGKVTDIACDLMDLEAVRKAATDVEAACKGVGLDALVLNAGIMAMPDEVTKDGYPIEMQTNHLSQVLLASKLMPCLTTAAERTGGKARIVNHSSCARHGALVNPAHYKVTEAGTLGGEKARWSRYTQTKFANACWVQCLKDKLADKGITSILCATAAPGLAATNLQATTAASGAGFGMQTLMRFSQSAADGSLPLLHAIVSPDIESGDFISPGKNGPLSWVLGDGVVGWPAKRNVAKEKCCWADQKDACWAATEAAIGPFF